MDFNTYLTDSAAEQDGKWFDFGPDAKIKLRAPSSNKSREVRKSLEKPFVALTRAGQTIPDDKLEEILIKQMAQALIVDWSGFTDNGVALDFSATAAEALLVKYPRLRNIIAKIISDDEAFSVAQKEDAVKN